VKDIKDLLLNLSVLLMLISVWIIFGIVDPRFFSFTNITGLLANVSGLMIITIGEILVLLTGGIDLSIGHVAAVSMIIAVSIAGQINDWVILLIITLSVGAVFGLINSFLIANIGIVSFICTLATGLIAKGMAFTITKGYALPIPENLISFGFEEWFKLPATFVISILIVIIFEFLLSQTHWGRYVVLLGSNEKGLKFSGVNHLFVKNTVYVISGLMSALGGFLISVNMGAALPGIGDNILLQCVGGAVLGGVALTGGIGSIWKGVTGVLLLSTITNGLNVWGVQWFDQLVILGLLLLVGTELTMLRR